MFSHGQTSNVFQTKEIMLDLGLAVVAMWGICNAGSSSKLLTAHNRQLNFAVFKLHFKNFSHFGIKRTKQPIEFIVIKPMQKQAMTDQEWKTVCVWKGKWISHCGNYIITLRFLFLICNPSVDWTCVPECALSHLCTVIDILCRSLDTLDYESCRQIKQILQPQHSSFSVGILLYSKIVLQYFPWKLILTPHPLRHHIPHCLWEP